MLWIKRSLISRCGVGAAAYSNRPFLPLLAFVPACVFALRFYGCMFLFCFDVGSRNVKLCQVHAKKKRTRHTKKEINSANVQPMASHNKIKPFILGQS